MITREAAYQKAKRFLLEEGLDVDARIVVPEKQIEDRGWCWVFYYDTRAAYETGDFKKSLLGNAPLAVVKKTGVMYVTGTAHSVDYFLEEILQGKGTPVPERHP